MIGRKIIRLYVKNDWISLIGIPIGFAIYVASYCFWYGDNAEELCSPFLIYGMYILLNCLKENSLPSKQEYFAIGMTSGFILWVKYTMLGFYLGWYIVPFVLMVKRKKWKEILRSIGWIAFGVFMISLPVLVYFVWNHALRYLWEVYFYDNIFLYTTKAADQMFFMTVLRALKMNVTQNFWLSLLIFFSFVWMYFQTSLRVISRIFVLFSRINFLYLHRRTVLSVLLFLFRAVYVSGSCFMGTLSFENGRSL